MGSNVETWTAERVDHFRGLLAKGLSFGAAATLIGVSRNAAIGKAKRIGLESSYHPQKNPRATIVRKAKYRPRRRDVSVRPVLQAIYDAPPTQPGEFLMIRLFDLQTHHCRFPIGDPLDAAFAYCGHDYANGSAYCAYHHRVVYTPPMKRIKERT